MTVAIHRAEMSRRIVFTILSIDVCLSLYEALNHIQEASQAGNVKWSPEALIARINLRPMLNKSVDKLEVAFARHDV